MIELNTLELATVSGGTTKTLGTSAAASVDSATQTALTNITSSLDSLKGNQNKGGLDTTTAMALGLMMSQRNQSSSQTIIAGGGGGFFHSSVTRW